jgi:hypothetical protein
MNRKHYQHKELFHIQIISTTPILNPTFIPPITPVFPFRNFSVQRFPEILKFFVTPFVLIKVHATRI